MMLSFQQQKGPPKGSLQFQVCVYPWLDGGIYFNLHLSLFLLRLSLGFIDFRIWFDYNPGPVPPLPSVNQTDNTETKGLS